MSAVLFYSSTTLIEVRLIIETFNYFKDYKELYQIESVVLILYYTLHNNYYLCNLIMIRFVRRT